LVNPAPTEDEQTKNEAAIPTDGLTAKQRKNLKKKLQRKKRKQH
jgi:hypothetical protein